MLATVAAMIGCPIPPTAVLTKYIEMLEIYPEKLLNQAGNLVLGQHIWNNFPRVAEFISIIKDQYRSMKNARLDTLNVLGFYTGKKESDMHRIAPPPVGGKGPRSLGAVLPQITRRNDE